MANPIWLFPAGFAFSAMVYVAITPFTTFPLAPGDALTLKFYGVTYSARIAIASSATFYSSMFTLKRSAATRDPAYWPFAATSPWNYPIGSQAQYAVIAAGMNVPDDVTKNGSNDLIINYVCGGNTWVGASSNPRVNIIAGQRDSGGGPTHVYNTNTFPVNVPSGAPGPAISRCSDQELTIIGADHLIAYDGQSVIVGRGAITIGLPGWSPMEHVDLEGPGWGPNMGPLASNGTHNPDGQGLAAYFPVFAGTIRAGELRAGIPHAMSLSVDSDLLNRHAPGGNSWVWPATNSDDPANPGSLYGNYGNLHMGSLVAIPPSVNLNTLGLKTIEAINVAKALQNYGAYPAATFGAPGVAMQLRIDFNARTDLPDEPGYTGPSTAVNYHTDLAIIARLLQVVTNSFNPTTGGPPRNGHKIDGGDGALRAPTAPPFNR